MQTASVETGLVETGNGEAEEQISKVDRNRSIYEKSTFDGWSYQRIANEFGISKTHCWKIVQDTGKDLVSEFAEDIRAMRVHHTLQLKSMIGELREAWEASKQPLRIEKTGTGLKGKPIKETTLKHNGGDPRYLDSAARLLTDIRSIWGADAPKQSTVEISGETRALVEIVVENREEAIEFSRLIESKAKLIETEQNSVASQLPSEPVDATAE